MKLLIRRDQADVKGMLGGHKGVQFTLSYRLVTTAEEDDIIARYRLGTHVVTTRGSSPETVDRLRAGMTQTLPSVDILIGNERVIRDACMDFGQLMAVARSFGGEEAVDIPTSIEAIVANRVDSEG
jgi:hypothetical protein